eukprot:767469-Hanusia_phi.AAC.3
MVCWETAKESRETTCLLTKARRNLDISGGESDETSEASPCLREGEDRQVAESSSIFGWWYGRESNFTSSLWVIRRIILSE